MPKKVFSDYKLDNGESIYTQEYIQGLRDADRKHPDKLKIIAQRGGQEDMLAIDADIKICGGSRGGPLSKDTLVITQRGDVPIGSLTENDYVVDFNGRSCEILAVKDYGMLPSYELVFSDGSSVVCSEDHTWNVYVTGDKGLKALLTMDIVDRKSVV